MIDSKRRTGRTTRMIEAAIRLAESGQEVTIVMQNAPQAMTTRSQIFRLADPIARARIQIVPVDALNHFSWRTLSPGSRFTYGESRYLVDHFVIESEWQLLLEAWTLFDLPTPDVYQTPPDSMEAEPFVPRKRRMILGDSS